MKYSADERVIGSARDLRHARACFAPPSLPGGRPIDDSPPPIAPGPETRNSAFALSGDPYSGGGYGKRGKP